MSLLKEPLIHFLFIGLILFTSYSALSPDSDGPDNREIVVDRVDLIRQMRYQNRTVDTEGLEYELEIMSPSQRQALIAAYIRDEALFREARALGLDRQDPVARRRLIRNLEYIATSFVVIDDHISDEDVRIYFGEHKIDYFRPAELTFTHIFFSHEIRGKKDARRQAEETLQSLNTDRVPYRRGLEYGDRFLYHTNYASRRANEIASHFGTEVQRQLFQLDVDEQTWKGPFTSLHGEHLVMVVHKKWGHLPALAEVREQIVKDIQRTRLEAESEKAIQSVIRAYEVTVAESLLRHGDGESTYDSDIAIRQ